MLAIRLNGLKKSFTGYHHQEVAHYHHSLSVKTVTISTMAFLFYALVNLNNKMMTAISSHLSAFADNDTDISLNSVSFAALDAKNLF
jgi:hypothetical protein